MCSHHVQIDHAANLRSNILLSTSQLGLRAGSLVVETSRPKSAVNLKLLCYHRIQSYKTLKSLHPRQNYRAGTTMALSNYHFRSLQEQIVTLPLLHFTEHGLYGRLDGMGKDGEDAKDESDSNKILAFQS
jgi:hypothetical protein